MDKKLIAERFAKAATTYTQEACVQHQIAERMTALLSEHIAIPLQKVVEFGCGTGNLSRMIYSQFQPQELLLNDLCSKMGDRCTDLFEKGVDFVEGDAEQIAFPNNRDLITSCSTLQWFESPNAFFKKCKAELSAEGYLAFSTFGKKNMEEIRHTTHQGLSYLSLDELCQSLADDYDILHADEQIIEQYFDEPKQVLRHLKATGVTGISNPRWTPRILMQFCEQYGKLYTYKEGVRLTYHPIYIIAKKKKS